MKSLQRSIGGLLAVLALVVTAIAFNLHAARSSDHQQSPTTVARPPSDITDMFVYPSPADPTRVVFQLDVFPLLTPGAATSGAALDPAVLYQFKIAHGKQTGQSEDTVIQVQASGTGSSQTINLYGPVAPASIGTQATVTGLAQNFPYNKATQLNNGIQAFVGPRADPFFFDLFQFFKIIPDRDYHNQPNPPAPTATSFRGFTAAFNTTNGTACDTTPSSDAISSNSFNMVSIVVEMPKSLINTPSPLINVWATTSTQSGS